MRKLSDNCQWLRAKCLPLTALGLRAQEASVTKGSLSLLPVISPLSPTASTGAVLGLPLPQWPGSGHGGLAPENLQEHTTGSFLHHSFLVSFLLCCGLQPPPQSLSSPRAGGSVEDAGVGTE